MIDTEEIFEKNQNKPPTVQKRAKKRLQITNKKKRKKLRP
jgi:hypothetical protein